MNSIFTSKEIQTKAYIIGGLTFFLIAVQVINMFTGYSLIAYGIEPRDVTGLGGIVFSPFIHGSFQHLFSNIFAFAVMGGLIIWNSIERFVKVSLFIMLTCGLLVWGLGPGQILIVGASGIIFGYFGYLLSSAFINKDPTSILIAVVVGLSYGGIIFGILPGAPGVSWESHLAGLICGISAAWVWRKKNG